MLNAVSVTLRTELVRVVEALLLTSENPISLNTVGDHIGALAVSPTELEEIFANLERAGRSVSGDISEPASHSLGVVITAARELRRELGRPARVEELVERSGVSADRVRGALLLVQVMQR